MRYKWDGSVKTQVHDAKTGEVVEEGRGLRGFILVFFHFVFFSLFSFSPVIQMNIFELLISFTLSEEKKTKEDRKKKKDHDTGSNGK